METVSLASEWKWAGFLKIFSVMATQTSLCTVCLHNIHHPLLRYPSFWGSYQRDGVDFLPTYIELIF